jgi:hypothetical protein
MSEPVAEMRAGTRRGFLLGAGVAAGGVAVLGADLPAATRPTKSPPAVGGQTPAPGGQPPAPGGQPPAAGGQPGSGFRSSAPPEKHLSQLGPLRELAGTWVGRGFNLISLPDFDNPQGPQPFRLKLNGTHETLEFQHIGGNIPNRGSTGQKDINLFGLTYLQRVSDSITNGALHIEPGLWLHVPATTVPEQPETVVRQGSIPHGTSILAQGAVIQPVSGGPQIHAVDSTPFDDKGPITDPTYLAPFNSATLPPGFRPPFLKNPNLALEDAILGQTIVKTVVLSISTKTSGAPSFKRGGVLNIPFLVSNANASQLDAIFWIETVQQPDGTQFLQLQYTQTIILNFLNINWPHITVATLVKQ